MKRTTILAALVMACGGTKSGGTTATPTPSSKAANAPAVVTHEAGELAGEDILAKVLEMNSDKYGRPPTGFRKGHVKPMTSPKVKRTKRGFEVKFASGAPVVTPAVYQGKVYVSGGFRSKEFHAFVATTGKPAWSVSLDDDGPSSTACEDGVCVFNTESCTIFALDAKTGKMRWSWWLGDPLTSSPTIANGRVFTSYPAHTTSGGKERPPGATHVLVAFDLKSGEILWQKWLDSDVMSAPVAAKDFLYVTTFAGTVMKLEHATGKVRYAIRGRATSAPVIDFADGQESMYYTRRADDEDDGAEEMIIRADDNEPKTKYKANRKKAKYLDSDVQKDASYAKEGSANDSANGFSGGAPASANAEAAYMNVGQASVATIQAFQGSRILHFEDRNYNTMGDEVIATSAETGERLWSYKLDGDTARQGGFLGTAPLAAGDSVLFATLAGDVVRVDPKSGTVRAKYEVGARVRSQPVVVGGWIYVGTEDGRLVAINTGDPKLTGWPTWGGNSARTGIRVASR